MRGSRRSWERRDDKAHDCIGLEGMHACSKPALTVAFTIQAETTTTMQLYKGLNEYCGEEKAMRFMTILVAINTGSCYDSKG